MIPVDEDPLGLTLLEKDPLAEASRLVALLSAHAGAFMETHLMAFDVAVKRGKFLLAARAVIRCVALGGFFLLVNMCVIVCFLFFLSVSIYCVLLLLLLLIDVF